jgi:hypothetical protein
VPLCLFLSEIPFGSSQFLAILLVCPVRTGLPGPGASELHHEALSTLRTQRKCIYNSLCVLRSLCPKVTVPAQPPVTFL